MQITKIGIGISSRIERRPNDKISQEIIKFTNNFKKILIKKLKL